MNDTTDNTTFPDPGPSIDDLLAAIRHAIADDAGADVRSAGALACRAILGVLEPASRASISPPPFPPQPSPSATSPLASLFSVIGRSPASGSATGSLPPEQLLALLGGALRSILSQGEPRYRSAPGQTGTPPPDGGR